MPEKTNDNIPLPLRHAGTVMATQRQAPKRPSQDRNGDEKRRTASTPKVANGVRAARRDRPLLQAPVKVPLGLVVQLAQATRYMPGPVWAAKVRYAVANVVLACPGAKTHPEEDLWDLMGRWHSGVRSLKTIEGVTERHHGWRHVQRVLVAMQRAENDPTLQSKLRRPNSQFLREALKRLDYELELYFQKHPECLMSPEEVAGMAPMPPDVQADWPLFQRPKAKPGIKGGVASVIEPTMAEELVVQRRVRGPQKAALFGRDCADTQATD